MKIMRRSYQMKRRAEAQDRTRQKIVDATIELHQSKGLAATTVGDIADRAGVGKVTVYRHFPDDGALVEACSGQYFERHPFPDLESWRKIANRYQRLRRGLRDTFRYHQETELMMTRVLPEAHNLSIMDPYHAHWQRAVEILAEPWTAGGRDKAMLQAGLALAVAFETWHLLVRVQRLTNAQAIELMMRVIGGGPAPVDQPKR
jgi:AcrR family transcriptional regulator